MKISKKFIAALILFVVVFGCKNNTKEEATVDEKINLILKKISEPIIPDYTVSLHSFVNDSIPNYQEVFKKAIEHLEEKGGGKLIVEEGEFEINGPIHLISKLNLHLEKGAHLKFGSNPKDYLPVVKTSWEGTFIYNYSPFIYGHNLNNVCISGAGTIDGEASESWNNWKKNQLADQLLSREMNHNSTPIEERIFGDGHFLRPQLIQFFDCKNILIKDIKVEDSPFWCIHLLRSENIIVRGVKYDAQNKNNDGIDPEYSRNVLIENVEFNNSDDNVAIKAGRDNEGRASSVCSENIIIRNCKFKGLHALVIGSEMSAGVKNVFVQNCSFAGDLKRGIYLKSNPDRGGFIRNIYVKDVDFGKTEDCFFITSYYKNEGEGHTTAINNVHFENISCKTATNHGIVIQGFPQKKIQDIYFTNIKIESAKNAMSLSECKNIVFNDIVIGKMATAPSSVK